MNKPKSWLVYWPSPAEQVQGFRAQRAALSVPVRPKKQPTVKSN